MRSAAWDAWVAKARAKDILDDARARPDLKLKSGRKGKELVGPCPHCGGEDGFAVTSTARKKVFRCRGCGAKGDVISLVMFLDSCAAIFRVRPQKSGSTRPRCVNRCQVMAHARTGSDVQQSTGAGGRSQKSVATTVSARRRPTFAILQILISDPAF